MCTQLSLFGCVKYLVTLVLETVFKILKSEQSVQQWVSN